RAERPDHPAGRHGRGAGEQCGVAARARGSRSRRPIAPSHSGAVAGRIAVVCLGTAGLVVLLGGGDAFWLCLPTALLLAAPARRPREAVAGPAFAVAAAAAPSLASASLGPRPPLLMALVATGSSVAILEAVVRRLEGERESFRG